MVLLFIPGFKAVNPAVDEHVGCVSVLFDDVRTQQVVESLHARFDAQARHCCMKTSLPSLRKKDRMMNYGKREVF